MALNPIRKSLYVRDRSSSKVRILESGVGLGLLGFGVGRSPMLGKALGIGLRQAKGADSRAATEALQLAQSAHGVLARGSARGERAVRQVKAVNQAIERVPTRLRPAVATTAGLLLIGNAHPIRRESYHPVNIRIRTGVNQ